MAPRSVSDFADDPGGLHWESHGIGRPVLLIMGLGLSGGAWWRTVPVLSRHFRVITFDNRGVGRSKSLTYSYTTEAMADDAASVLDSAGIASASLYGISLGGMVAQQLALAASPARRVLGARRHASGRTAGRFPRSRGARLLPPPTGSATRGSSVGFSAIQLRARLPSPARGANRRGCGPAARASIPSRRLSSAALCRWAPQLPWPPVSHTGADDDRARSARQVDPGGQCRADGRSDATRAARDPRALWPPVPDRAA